MSGRRALLSSSGVYRVLTRSAFTARKPDYTNPNWLRVGLAFGSTIALWTLFMEIKGVHQRYNRVNEINQQEEDANCSTNKAT